MSLTELDQAAARRAFDRAAPGYDLHAALQQEVEARLLERLDLLHKPPECIVDIGCGTGRATRQMQERFPKTRVIGLDWSPAMLLQARQRQAASDGLQLCADMHHLPLAPASVDLIFSSLAIQWSTRFEDLMLTFRRCLKPGGMLVFSTFGPDTLHELRQAWAAVDQTPHVNHFLDMHDIGDGLLRAGFAEPVMEMDLLTLEYGSVLELMRDLKGIGAHNVARERRTGLTGKQAFQRVLDAYEPFARDGIYPASYEVIYGVAHGPREGQPMRTAEGDMATFSIDALLASRNKAK